MKRREKKGSRREEREGKGKKYIFICLVCNREREGKITITWAPH